MVHVFLIKRETGSLSMIQFLQLKVFLALANIPYVCNSLNLSTQNCLDVLLFEISREFLHGSSINL